MGATLTLDRRDGNLLIAFTAVFVGIVTERLWRVACMSVVYLFYNIRTETLTKGPIDSSTGATRPLNRAMPFTTSSRQFCATQLVRTSSCPQFSFAPGSSMGAIAPRFNKRLYFRSDSLICLT